MDKLFQKCMILQQNANLLSPGMSRVLHTSRFTAFK